MIKNQDFEKLITILLNILKAFLALSSEGVHANERTDFCTVYFPVKTENLYIFLLFSFSS